MKGQSDLQKSEWRVKNVMVLGTGSWAFGKENRAVRMFSGLSRIRCFFLISKWEDGSVSALLRKYGFEFESTSYGYLGLGKPLWTLNNLAQLPRLYATLVRTYFRKRTDIIVILNIAAFINAFFPIVALKLFAGAKLVFYLGDGPRNDRFHRALGRVINRVMDRMIVISQSMKREFARVGIDETQITVVYNGVDLEKFIEACPEDFRQAFGWPADTILIGYVGQCSAVKGVWDFVKAAEVVLQSHPHCRFVLIGKVDEGNSYQRAIVEYANARGLSSCVVFTGWLNKIEPGYAALDVVVVTDRHELGAPNVNIEAMASGLPVVATRVGGTPEMVIDGETGFLVEKENPEQIADCILRLARDAELRKKMGSAGRKRARQMFDIRRNACLLEEVLLSG